VRSVEIPLRFADTGQAVRRARIGARLELNPLGAVRVCQKVNAFAFLAHDGDSNGHQSRIALMNSPSDLGAAFRKNLLNQMG